MPQAIFVFFMAVHICVGAFCEPPKTYVGVTKCDDIGSYPPDDQTDLTKVVFTKDGEMYYCERAWSHELPRSH